MLIHFLVILTILIAFAGLVVHENNINIFKPAEQAATKSFLWLGERSLLGAVVQKGIKAHKKDMKDKALQEYKDFLAKVMKNSGVEVSGIYGGDSEWNPVSVHIKPEGLHHTRRILRLTLGSWNDKIVPGLCDENYMTKRFELSVSYEPKEDFKYPTVIRTKYDLDNLPKGLLKEGCKVEKEVKTHVTCSIKCAA